MPAQGSCLSLWSSLAYARFLASSEMANNFLLLGTLGTLGWVIFNTPPATEPTLSRVSASDAFVVASVNASRRPPLEARRDPVPLVRNAQAPFASLVISPSNEAAAPATEQQAQDDLDRRAAKAAIEQDGYKRVSILDKVGSSAWRAKAYRGTVEVVLTVDGTGRVSLD